jgi:hypothetical protein
MHGSDVHCRGRNRKELNSIQGVSVRVSGWEEERRQMINVRMKETGGVAVWIAGSNLGLLLSTSIFSLQTPNYSSTELQFLKSHLIEILRAAPLFDSGLRRVVAHRVGILPMGAARP